MEKLLADVQMLFAEIAASRRAAAAFAAEPGPGVDPLAEEQVRGEVVKEYQAVLLPQLSCISTGS